MEERPSGALSARQMTKQSDGDKAFNHDQSKTRETVSLEETPSLYLLSCQCGGSLLSAFAKSGVLSAAELNDNS